MKTGKKHIILYVILLLLVFVSCSDRRTVIGVSQCSDDLWRQKVNREIKIGQYQYKNVDVVFASADNNGQRQARQIDSLVKAKVDLLVVAPSDVKTVAPAIERAYRAGIPVILYDRMFLERFKKAAKSHIGDANLRMDDLGSELSLSKVQMYRKVKALTGKTPAEVLREMRMQKAYSLLKQTDKTISEVAAEVGFAIPGYFSACFKKQFGINPTELRD